MFLIREVMSNSFRRLRQFRNGCLNPQITQITPIEILEGITNAKTDTTSKLLLYNGHRRFFPGTGFTDSSASGQSS
jgi:hypothetical protein